MSEKNTFFVSTPIYYTNGIPHIGHSYSSLIADSIARFQKISGKRVKFSTWVDENSQKIVDSAEKDGKEIWVYLDEMAAKHKEVWDGLGLDYTDFIRTTESRHHELVREVLQKSFDAGDIYQGEYEGKYCVGCEAFKKDDDLIEQDGVLICPDHLKAPDTIKEKNYFFKLSKYQHQLEDFYVNNPEFVIPQDRFNEVIAFTKRWLEDFSVSRETNKFGIKLPFDESHVSYVWYDALFNYITVCQNGDEDFWPADLHVVGKDIIRFHAIYWPAMLMSAGFDLPKNILTTWFFTVDGQKISKSLWNAIDPVEFSEKYSKEMLTLYLLSTFNIGQDGDFDQKQALLTYNSKLANNFGNLVNRVVVLALKLQDKTWILDTWLHNTQVEAEWYAAPDMWNADEQVTLETINLTSTWMASYAHMMKLRMNEYRLKSALDTSFEFLDMLNKFADQKEPWKMIKEDEEGTREVLYTLAEWLRQVGLGLYAFFPDKMSEMFTKLWLINYTEQLESGKLQDLQNKSEVFNITKKWEALFQRIEITQ